MPGGYVCSASFKGQARASVKETMDGQLPIRKLFSKPQRSFFATHAPEGLELDDLLVLGPITAFKLKVLPAGLERKLAVELWLYPDGSRIMELSTKCAPADWFEATTQARDHLLGARREPLRRAGREDAHRAGVLRRSARLIHPGQVMPSHPSRAEPCRMERDVLPIPDRPFEGLITYDAKDPDTSFPPIEPLRPPAGAPNVLVVLLDDVGVRRLERVRRALLDADGGATGRERAEVQPLPHDRAVLADAPGAADRTQPPLRGDGRDHRDRHVRAGLQLDSPELCSAARGDAQAQRLLDRTVRQVPRGAGLGDEPAGAVRRLAVAAAGASSTSTASSAARPTSTRLRCTKARFRSSRTAPRRRATTSPRT